jgi:CRISPR-associated protein Cas1
MSALYLNEQRSRVHLDEETLVIHYPENKQTGEAARKQRVPLMKVSQVVVYGNITLTTPAITALMEQKAEICYLTRHGKFIGRVSGDDHRHGALRLKQRRAHDDPTAALHVAMACVRAKLHNQRTLLLRSNRERGDAEVAAAADQLREAIAAVDALPTEDAMPPDPSRPQEGTVMGVLGGYEGMAGRAYFAGYSRLFKGVWAGVMNGRSKRPPSDAVNAMLSFGYSLLTNQATGAAHAVGFDPYIGFMHSTVYGRPALALDIIEMFRAPLVDSLVLTLANQRMLTPDDFEETLGSWRLTDNARKLFLQQYEKRMAEVIIHPVFKTKVSYRRCIDLQFRLLSRWLLGELKRVREFYIR